MEPVRGGIPSDFSTDMHFQFSRQFAGEVVIYIHSMYQWCKNFAYLSTISRSHHLLKMLKLFLLHSMSPSTLELPDDQIQLDDEHLVLCRTHEHQNCIMQQLTSSFSQGHYKNLPLNCAYIICSGSSVNSQYLIPCKKIVLNKAISDITKEGHSQLYSKFMCLSLHTKYMQLHTNYTLRKKLSCLEFQEAIQTKLLHLHTECHVQKNVRTRFSLSDWRSSSFYMLQCRSHT